MRSFLQIEFVYDKSVTICFVLQLMFEAIQIEKLEIAKTVNMEKQKLVNDRRQARIQNRTRVIPDLPPTCHRCALHCTHRCAPHCAIVAVQLLQCSCCSTLSSAILAVQQCLYICQALPSLYTYWHIF